MRSVRDDVADIVSSIIGQEELDADYLCGKDLFENLKFDSISIMELVADIEEKFDIDLGEDELIESISKFELLVKLVEEKIG